MQKERQARELAEKEKNELLEKLNRLEEEATKARDGKILELLLSLLFFIVCLFFHLYEKTHIFNPVKEDFHIYLSNNN